MKRPLLVTLVVMVASGAFISAKAQQPYALANSASTLLLDRNGASLNNETPTTAGNNEGQLIQLGYFSTATDVSLFSGTWMPLAQFLSGDSASGTVNVPNGRISLTVSFDTSNNATNFPLGATQVIYPVLSAYPTAGTPLGIRWYDTKTTSGFFNTASATNWDWLTPSGVPSVSVSLDLATAIGLAFQDNSNQFKASIPEPSSMVLLGFGIVVPLLRRRR